MQETTNTYCRNCEAPIQDPFCSQCGQRTSVHRVTFQETFTDVVSGVFSFEAPFARTLYGLLVHPGKLLREYLAGRRRSYFKPVSFFILLTVIYILIRSLLNFDPLDDFPKRPMGIQGSEVFIEAAQFMVRNINNILFVFVFTLSIFMKLFFFRSYRWAEYMAVAFYLTGMYILFGIFNLFFMKYSGFGAQYLSMVVMLFYFTYAMVSFFTKNRFLVAVGAVLAYALGTVSYVFLGYLLSLILVSLT